MWNYESTIKKASQDIATAMNRAPVDANDITFTLSFPKSKMKSKPKDKFVNALLGPLNNTIYCGASGWSTIDSLTEGADLNSTSILALSENEDYYTVVVRPVGLNFVAFISLPFTRSESHPVSVDPGTWGVALGRVPWHRFVQKPARYHEITIIDAGTLLLHHYVGPENRFSESKLPEAIDTIDNATVLSYLRGSITPMLNGLPANQTGCLWLGVEDESSAVVGIPQPASDSVVTALTQYAKVVTPPLQASQLTVERFTVDWDDEKYNWRDSQFLKISSDEGRSLMKLSLGVCRIYEDEEEAKDFYAEVPRVIVDGMKQYVREEAMSVEWLKNVLSKASQTDLDLISNRSSDWFEDADESWRLIERHVIKVTFKADGDSLGAYYEHESNKPNWSGHALVFDESNGEPMHMTKHQVWLRLKGLSCGASQSGVFSCLHNQTWGKLILANGEPEIGPLKYCVHEYLNKTDVSFDQILSVPAQVSEFVDEASRRGYVLVTSYGAWSLCETLLDRLCKDDYEVKVLVFVSITDAANIDVIERLEACEHVVDVAILTTVGIPAALREAVVPSPPEVNFEWKNLFERVPGSTASVEEFDVTSITNSWINREVVSPTWEMVQMGYVVATSQCQRVLAQLRDCVLRVGSSQHFRIYQGHAGSGATAMMYRLAWDLQNESTTRVSSFIVRHDFSAEALQLFLQYLDRWQGHSVTVFIDTDIQNTFRELIINALKSKSVHVVEFIGGTMRSTPPGDWATVDPTLTDEDVKKLSPILEALFPNASDVLVAFKKYIVDHPSDVDSRHIYVLMLMATLGKFTPVHVWLRNELTELNQKEPLHNLNFLALVSAYCPTLRFVHRDAIDNYKAFGRLVSVWRSRPKVKVYFCHPFLARKYLDQLLECFPETYPRLSAVLLEAEGVAHHLHTDERALFFSGLLQMRWPNNSWPFSTFVRKLLNTNDTGALIDMLLSDVCRCPIKKGHRWIVLSRLLRVLGRFKESVRYAELAEAEFRLSDNKHFMACSNLGEAFGTIAKTKETGSACVALSQTDQQSEIAGEDT